ncbi:hypothetical protein LWI28_026085 [Acer negundo]|uniref:Disease resistance R13L4/SHOC-2-like LRR domain-containing protein n=1 Tax=Acer negundo TaxID=4023 RepID=A0AAD5IP44_ACENE|nr:hypothetical protein LWI28_026085 [Acer negundo]
MYHPFVSTSPKAKSQRSGDGDGGIGSLKTRKLEKFSLKNCRSLKRLPDCIGKLSSLKELSLDSSALEELPYSIGLLAELEKLNLMRCKSLTAIPDSIGNLKSLEELLFDSSSIKELPASVGSLFRLKNLSLGYCRSLSKLPDSIEGLASLVKLRLEGTLITEVPVQIGTLNLVKKLEMGNCQLLKYLPQSIGKMLSITTLVLDESRITELPESIGMLERLIVLKLNKCKQLQRLPSSIGNLKSLQYLLMAETSSINLKKLNNLSMPGSKIPNWFSQEVIFSKRKNREIKGVIIADELRYQLPAIVDIRAKILAGNRPKFTTTLYLLGVPKTNQFHVHLCRYPPFHPLVSMLKDGYKISVDPKPTISEGGLS